MGPAKGNIAFHSLAASPNRRSAPAYRRLAVAIAVTIALTALTGCHPSVRVSPSVRPAAGPIRAIWVTRWDYRSARDIAKVMENCRGAGFNTVLFQVRGNGTVFYRSRIEPWADEIGGCDPGFDPLAVACREAHRRGLSLHAWVNVYPGWRGDKPPTNRKQLYHTHPDWFLRDAWGRRQPLGWYCSLNPCYPQVRRYLVAVLREIVANYPVDGLHLDYIRFVNERSRAYPRQARVPDYPRDSRTLALFHKITGKTPDTAPTTWNHWRAESVTRLVRDIRTMIRKVNPRAKLSAAVGASPDEAKKRHFQDTARWLAEGLLDAVYPMNYAADVATYRKRLNVWAAIQPRVPVVTGVMFDKRDASTVLKQIRLTTANRRLATANRRLAAGTGAHFAAFAYNSLFERLDQRGKPIMDAQSASRAALRDAVIPHLRRQTVASRRCASGRRSARGPATPPASNAQHSP